MPTLQFFCHTGCKQSALARDLNEAGQAEDDCTPAKQLVSPQVAIWQRVAKIPLIDTQRRAWSIVDNVQLLEGSGSRRASGIWWQCNSTSSFRSNCCSGEEFIRQSQWASSSRVRAFSRAIFKTIGICSSSELGSHLQLSDKSLVPASCMNDAGASARVSDLHKGLIQIAAQHQVGAFVRHEWRTCMLKVDMAASTCSGRNSA